MKHALFCLLAYWRGHKLQCAISILGVALGVAVVTAMDLANASALASFRQSIGAVSGRATHQVLPAEGFFSSGVPEELFAKVARVDGVLAAAPIVEAHGILLANPGTAVGGTPREQRELSERAGTRDASAVVRVLGVDPFSEEAFRPLGGLGGTGVPARQTQIAAGDDAHPTEPSRATSPAALEDWLLRDDACVMPHALAARMGVQAGDSVTLVSSGKRHLLRVIATYGAKDALSRGTDDVLLMDIAAAQERFFGGENSPSTGGRGVAGIRTAGVPPVVRTEDRRDAGGTGTISAIDLLLPEGAAGEETAARVRAILPDGVRLERPAERAGRTEALLDAFQLNLTALSLLALVVGVFLVHNTLTVAVLQRIPAIGTLRCLGVASSSVRRAVLLEALALGCIGSAFGLLAGAALAGVFLQRVGGIVSDLYAHIGVLAVFYDPAAIAKGAVLGIAASLAGAYFPAREAAFVTPVQALRRSRVDTRAQRAWKFLALAGVVSIAAAAILALLPVASPVPGLAAAFALALGGALCSPALTRWISRGAAEPLARVFGTLGLLAARGISTHLSRTGLAVGALGMALSMTIGVALMVASFRETLNRWMDQTVHADLFIRPAGPALLRHRAFLPLEILEQLRQRPEVEAVDTYRGRELSLADGSPVLVVATDDLGSPRARTRFPLLEGDTASVLEGLRRGGVVISETLARKKNLHVGGSISLPTAGGGATGASPVPAPNGRGARPSPAGTEAGPTTGRDAGATVELPIVGVYYEYATDRGVINMDVPAYERIFGDARANSAAVFLKPGVELEPAFAALRRDLGVPAGLYIFSNRALREEALHVFDRTFAITGQLENLSLAVGLCGILSALLALLRERSADFALLRALGLPRSGLSRLVALEGLLLGGVAFGVACILGPALALLLIHVINLRAFGWTIVFALHAEVFIRVGISALIISALAGVYPAWRARKLSIALALREE